MLTAAVLDELDPSPIFFRWHDMALLESLHERARQGLKLALAVSSTFLEGFEKHEMEHQYKGTLHSLYMVRQSVLCQHILRH